MDWYKKYLPGIIYLMFLLFVYKCVFVPVATKACNVGILPSVSVIITSGVVSFAMYSLGKKDLNVIEEYAVLLIGMIADCTLLACITGMFHWYKVIEFMQNWPH